MRNPPLFSVDKSKYENSTEENPHILLQTEMTLRDLFAAFAMAGELAAQDLGSEKSYMPAEVAEIAYKTADAMLEARTK